MKGMPRCQGRPVGKGPAPRRRCNGSRSLGLGAYDALRGTGTCIRYEPLLGPFLHRLSSASATEVPLDVNAAFRNLLLGISEDNLDGRSCEWREVSGVLDSSGAARISFLGCWGCIIPDRQARKRCISGCDRPNNSLNLSLGTKAKSASRTAAPNSLFSLPCKGLIGSRLTATTPSAGKICPLDRSLRFRSHRNSSGLATRRGSPRASLAGMKLRLAC